MDIILQILNILIIIGFLIVLLFPKFFLSKYLSKKGENLATKEDISIITRLVEEVKLKFTGEVHALVKRRETYEKIVHGMRVFIQGHSTTEESKNEMLGAYSKSWLWASDTVLKKLNHHLDLQMKRTTNPESVKQKELKASFTDCILEMRKDAGYENTVLEGKDFRFIKF